MEPLIKKELYEAPAIEVVAPDFEGVICASGGDFYGFGDETPLEEIA